MTVLLDSAAIERTNSFGHGIDVPPPWPRGPADRSRDDKDDAWWNGYRAGRDGLPCVPPTTMGGLLKRTFRAGYRRGAPQAPNIPGLAPTLVHASEMAEHGAVDETPIEPEPEPMTTEPVEVSAPDRAWFHGYGLARDGIDAAEPDNVSPTELAAWRDGRDAAIRGKATCEANRRASYEAACERARNRGAR